MSIVHAADFVGSGTTMYGYHVDVDADVEVDDTELSSAADLPGTTEERELLAGMVSQRLADKAEGLDAVSRLELINATAESLRDVNGADLSGLMSFASLRCELDRIRNEALAELVA